jgi:hypothetical protein
VLFLLQPTPRANTARGLRALRPPRRDGTSYRDSRLSLSVFGSCRQWCHDRFFLRSLHRCEKTPETYACVRGSFPVVAGSAKGRLCWSGPVRHANGRVPATIPFPRGWVRAAGDMVLVLLQDEATVFLPSLALVRRASVHVQETTPCREGQKKEVPAFPCQFAVRHSENLQTSQWHRR